MILVLGCYIYNDMLGVVDHHTRSSDRCCGVRLKVGSIAEFPEYNYNLISQFYFKIYLQKKRPKKNTPKQTSFKQLPLTGHIYIYM